MPDDPPAPPARRRPRPFPRAVEVRHPAPGPAPDPDPAAPAHAADRWRGLLEAQRAIAGDLSLTDMLGRIVRAACELVGARYGALGVLGEDGQLEQFVHHGLDDATVRRIGRLPQGPGMLGAPHDSALRAFIGVPIRVRGEVLGDLYLAEPAGGRFSADDEDLVTTLAGTAGTAIANARLHEDARRSRDWLHASGEITRALLADADADALLDVVSRALHVAEADYAALVLPVADGTKLQVAVATGGYADDFEGLVFDPKDSLMGQALISGESVLDTDMTNLTDPDFANAQGFGPVMIAPLVDARGVRGGVLLLRTAGRAPFHRRDLELLTSFADQVAVALDFDDARNDAAWLRVLEVRHRIVEDVHDNVIQRLFATGVGLQGLAKVAVPTTLSDRLGRHISDLDDTIDEIRERVFGLRENAAGSAQRIRGRFPYLPRDGRDPDGSDRND